MNYDYVLCALPENPHCVPQPDQVSAFVAALEAAGWTGESPRTVLDETLEEVETTAADLGTIVGHNQICEILWMDVVSAKGPLVHEFADFADDGATPSTTPTPLSLDELDPCLTVRWSRRLFERQHEDSLCGTHMPDHCWMSAAFGDVSSLGGRCNECKSAIELAPTLVADPAAAVGHFALELSVHKYWPPAGHARFAPQLVALLSQSLAVPVRQLELYG